MTTKMAGKTCRHEALFPFYGGVLTVRISEKEKISLDRRAKEEGTTAGALVRQMIQERSFTTAGELLSEMEAFMGDKRLKVQKRA